MLLLFILLIKSKSQSDNYRLCFLDIFKLNNVKLETIVNKQISF